MSEQALTRAYLSPAENVILGISGGCLETFVHMPLLTWKFCTQEGRALPRSIPAFYRGVFAQVNSVAPITGLQVVVNGFLEKVVSGGARDLSKHEKIVTSTLAGGFSALVYSPADLITIHQQKLGKPIMGTVTHLRNTYGVMGLFRGIESCAVREGIYTCGYLGLAPVLSQTFKDHQVLSSDLGCSLGGAVVAGIVSSLLSHPVDTCKTVVQADMMGKEYPNARTAFAKLVRANGLPALYKGGLPRMIRNIGAFFLVGLLREKFIDYKTAQLGLGVAP